MWEKQILVWATGINKKKLGVAGHFLLEIISNNYSKKNPKKQKVKYQAMYDVFYFFPNSSFIIPEKCMVTPNFLYGYQEHLLNSAFFSVLIRAKISVY